MPISRPPASTSYIQNSINALSKPYLRFLAFRLPLVLWIPLQLVLSVPALFLLPAPFALFAFFATITHNNFHYLRNRNRSHFVVIHMRNGEVQ